jgi:hypothetical protein
MVSGMVSPERDCRNENRQPAMADCTTIFFPGPLPPFHNHHSNPAAVDDDDADDADDGLITSLA